MLTFSLMLMNHSFLALDNGERVFQESQNGINIPKHAQRNTDIFSSGSDIQAKERLLHSLVIK